MCRPLADKESGKGLTAFYLLNYSLKYLCIIQFAVNHLSTEHDDKHDSSSKVH